jgi:ribosomal RNA-processing protein 12
MTPEVLGGKDNGVQKRGYKILTKLLESGKVIIDAPSIIQRLDDLSDGLSPAAKKVGPPSLIWRQFRWPTMKDRFNMLSLLIPLIPPSAMHIIPSLIPEAVLGTKEPSDKARTAAFELILTMARKMNEGGIVKRHLIHGNDKDDDLESEPWVPSILHPLIAF